MTKKLLGKKQGTTLECPGPEIKSIGVNRRGGHDLTSEKQKQKKSNYTEQRLVSNQL